MKPSMVPWEVASKHAKSGMICPPAKTSIRNRPPLISSTIAEGRRAAPWRLSSWGGQAVDIRHWIFGCAMTFGAATAADAIAANAPLAARRNRRRARITSGSSSCHQAMIGAFGHMVPRAHRRLELGEGRVHLPGHGSLLGLFPDHLRGQLPQIPQHRCGKRQDLDLALELRPEPLEGYGVL